MKYENWSLGYLIIKVYVAAAHRITHKKIVVTGRKNIPKNKPVVLAPNHQNGLSDSLAILTTILLQPVWLSRADLFRTKIARPFLRFIKIMPVYRIRDGKENLGKNDKTFADSINVLKNNKVLALFPEAAHSGRRHSIPHKKAVPRIVFMAEEKYNFELDIQVIPVGLYYSHFSNFGRNLIVNYGEPIAVKAYADKYKENQQATIIELRNDIREKLLPLTLDIRSIKYYEAFEQLRSIAGTAFRKKLQLKKSLLNQFKADQQLVAKLDNLEIKNPEMAEELAARASAFSLKLKKLKLRNWVVSNEGKNPLMFLLNKLLLFVTLPLFLYGFLLNIILFAFIDIVVKKKVKNPVFWSTFSIVAGLVLFPIFYFTLLAIAWTYLPTPWCKIGFLVSLPVIGRFAFAWYILFKKTVGRFRIIKMAFFNKTAFQSLVNEKDELVEEVLKL